VHSSDKESNASTNIQPKPKRKKSGKRKTTDTVLESDDVLPGKKKRKASTKKKGADKTTQKMAYLVDGVLAAWTDKTEYGQTFRAMNEDEQKAKLLTLNKGAALGVKVAIKKKVIAQQYKVMVAEKPKEHIIASRTKESDMFRVVPSHRDVQALQLGFLSVGEWVEVDTVCWSKKVCWTSLYSICAW
jgi:hypothetical protein